VYIAPLKALARERLKEWQAKFGPSSPLNWKVLELSGDTHYDQSVLEKADILVCTPEKWDLISRGWRTTGRNYISRVALLIIDEVHLLGQDRGGVLEAIVSRTRYISSFTKQQRKEKHLDSNSNADDGSPSEVTRIIGLSTALANPIDLADWLGVDTKGHGPTSMRGLYNFRPSVRPVPTIVHIQGYPGKHYCPRMATMNKPCFAAIKELSPTKPTLIFVASRRQTRLTAFDIISYAANENPGMFLGCSEMVAQAAAERVTDDALRHTITFGIGLHHAGLASTDRDIVEKMFLQREIKVLVATATLAWGVNLPAHLVIVKGESGKMKYSFLHLKKLLMSIDLSLPRTHN
jgi:activating signal cointegrator complex subunit 3